MNNIFHLLYELRIKPSTEQFDLARNLDIRQYFVSKLEAGEG